MNSHQRLSLALALEMRKDPRKTTHTRTKTRQTPQLLPGLRILNSLADQSSDLAPSDENHNSKGELMDVDFVGPDMVDGDGDDCAQDEQGDIAAPGGRCIEGEELVHKGADG